jgi:hypothetical protein
MLYRDLVDFEALPRVVQLIDVGEEATARQRVASYVISRRMADMLATLVVPQLQFDAPQDNRGLLIVGNYGTGKSHLMSVLSAVAERAELVDLLTDHAVADAMRPIAGRFLVLRLEIGASTRALRDTILDEIQAFADDLGVTVDVPAMDQVTNNKLVLMDIVGRIQEQHPGKGVLIIVDELLDFLESRKDQQLRLDLAFMRELGEVCAQTAFRFIAGIQESLFDAPRFQFVADSVRRVKDRFEQVRIAREDLAFVVEARLLRKSPAQRDRIQAHLSRFAARYSGMSERMDRFVRLFPVHPDYLAIFEQISAIEKRQVLQSLTSELASVLDQTVPEDGPGLLSYDRFWGQIADNASWRSLPDVREVLDKSQVLESRVQASFDRPDLQPLALQIIHALSVHRLTTGAIDVPIGATPAELRDTLCPITPPPNDSAEDVERVIRLALRQIERTVNNQFLSRNESGQYYLDLKKDVDYDALIDQRAESVDPEVLNRTLFTTLATLLERPEATYVQGYQIWPYELEWSDRHVLRPGYLFFGLPTERSTAQPPRDFYLYVLPFGAAQPQPQPDEVYVELVPDETFLSLLRRYAAASALRASSASDARRTYDAKLAGFSKAMLEWLQTQGGRAWRLSYGGHTRLLSAWPRGAIAARSLSEQINAASATCLSPQFAAQRPDYPSFTGFQRPISSQNREENVRAALQAIVGPIATQQGNAVLEALELLEGTNLRPRGSRYADYLSGLLTGRGEGQVVNRTELLQPVVDSQGNTLLEEEIRFRIEPEWLLVVLAALVFKGELVLALPGGQRIDSSNLGEGIRRPLRELLAFRHIERPRDLPLVALLELFQLLGLAEGLIRDPNQREDGVRALQSAVEHALAQVVQTQQIISRGLLLWNSALLEGPALGEAQRALDGYKRMLEGLRPFNTVGKLKNLRLTPEEIAAQAPVRQLQTSLEGFAGLVQELQPLAAYLTTAQAVLPIEHPFRATVQTAQNAQLALLRDPQRRDTPGLRAQLLAELTRLRQAYATAYVALHRAARLSATQDDAKKHLSDASRLRQLRVLAHITLLPRAQLDTFQADLGRLKPCFGLSVDDLRDGPVCPRCGYRPIEEPTTEPVDAALTRLSAELDARYATWLDALRENLSDPIATNSLDLWDDAAIRGSIRDVRDGGPLPDPLPTAWATAANAILAGLERLNLSRDDLLAAMGSTPLTREELEARLRRLLDTKLQGRDPRRVRIVVE